MSAPAIPNVLAERYASAEMRQIWSPTHKVVLERRLWLVVLRAQIEAGLDVPATVVDAYEAVVEDVNLASITEREATTRHDVKARIDEFCALAGHEQIHRAMTSRDLTENIEQAQLREAVTLVRSRLVAVLSQLVRLATEYADVAIAGRTHNVVAQVTTLGKRWATIGEEVLAGHRRLGELLEGYSMRGLKGPVGTQQDMVELLGSGEAVEVVEGRLAEHLGFSSVANSVGQIYPRAFDADVVAALLTAVAPLSNAARLVRLMAGAELAAEGFAEGQVGSSAMPHKMNARSSERLNGLMLVLRGHLTMAAGLAGDQWNEGDVSCSVVRRVVLPDACFATDGAIETALDVLNGFGVHPAAIEAELERNLPFLATTRLLAAAVATGAGREHARDVVAEHSRTCAAQMRLGNPNATAQMLAALADDARLNLNLADIEAALADPLELSGRAGEQVAAFVAAAQGVIDADPTSASYTPERVL